MTWLSVDVADDKQSEKIREWFRRHEDDIAENINDFGDLKYLFALIFHRLPGEKL